MKRKLMIWLPLMVLFSIVEAHQHVEEMLHHHNSDSFSLELIHRHAPQFTNDRLKTRHERLEDLLRHDTIRHGITSQRLQTRRRAGEAVSHPASIEMPLASARDYGEGQYVTTLKVGTPSQKFRLIVDTGSDLTWVRCRYGCSRRAGDCTRKGRINGKRVFHAPLSSSFSPIPCASEMCGVVSLFSLTTCPTPLTPCAYAYSYISGPEATGVFANETVTVGLTNGRRSRLRNVVIGCTNSSKGSTFDNVDGVMGLSNTKYSFTTFAAQKFGAKFSYCLVDHLSHLNATNYITFGTSRNRVKVSGKARYTRLELDAISSFYAVNIMGISIGGKMLEIPMKVWDTTQGGGTILDSGTSLTFLADPAYQAVMEVLTKSVSKYQRVKLDGIPIDYCFNSTTGFDETSVLKLIIHFDNGAQFEPHWNSYIIAAADGVRCLGFSPAGFPAVSTIGNIMQQNYLWEFDLEGKKLGFAPSACNNS
ncbi:NANA [Hibiscus trionum]|uniref:NANA n=1 Tax=Hibiscus trionum TaxID=183268 RepID=A0A9W7HVL4_HIBTR|nr:NANA [Hibiscus trionum]